jgi:CBS domain-containing protein
VTGSVDCGLDGAGLVGPKVPDTGRDRPCDRNGTTGPAGTGETALTRMPRGRDDDRVKHRTVADVMTRDVLKGRPAMPLKELARVLAEHGVSALPVLDPDDRLIGVVSESDLLAAGTRPRRLLRWWSRDRGRRGTVGAVMSRSPVVIGPDATLAEAARRMADRGVKRLPVVDEHGALVGVVSRSDLVKVFLRSDDEIRDEIVGEVLVHLLWVDPTEIEVPVIEGVVTLAGVVDNSDVVDTAERLVRRVDGVVDVRNVLTSRVVVSRRRRPLHRRVTHHDTHRGRAT